MKLIKVLAIGLLAFALTGCGKSSSESGMSSTVQTTASVQETLGYTQISMEDAVKIMKDETGYLIVDVRTPEEFAAGHIPDAINVPNETIAENAAKDLPDKDRLLLIYCRSGNRSKQASSVLAGLGYTNVKEFGGIKDWTGETVTEN